MAGKATGCSLSIALKLVMTSSALGLYLLSRKDERRRRFMAVTELQLGSAPS